MYNFTITLNKLGQNEAFRIYKNYPLEEEIDYESIENYLKTITDNTENLNELSRKYYKENKSFFNSIELYDLYLTKIMLLRQDEVISEITPLVGEDVKHPKYPNIVEYFLDKKIKLKEENRAKLSNSILSSTDKNFTVGKIDSPVIKLFRTSKDNLEKDKCVAIMSSEDIPLEVAKRIKKMTSYKKYLKQK